MVVVGPKLTHPDFWHFYWPRETHWVFEQHSKCCCYVCVQQDQCRDKTTFQTFLLCVVSLDVCNFILGYGLVIGRNVVLSPHDEYQRTLWKVCDLQVLWVNHSPYGIYFCFSFSQSFLPTWHLKRNKNTPKFTYFSFFVAFSWTNFCMVNVSNNSKCLCSSPQPLRDAHFSPRLRTSQSISSFATCPPISSPMRTPCQ